MFESLEELTAHLRATAPVIADPRSVWPPVLDPDRAVVTEIIELERCKAMVDARIMTLTAELADRAEAWVDPREVLEDGGPSAATLVAAELGPALHLTPTTAAMRVARAQNVRDRLPGTLRLMSRGDLDLGRVLVIAEAAGPLADDDVAKLEERVLPGAVNQTAGELRAALRQAVIAIDPESAERRRKAAVKGRRVVQFPLDDGTSAFEAVLSAIDTGEIYDLVDEVARRTKTSGDARSIDARRADAFVWLVLGRDPHLGPQDPEPPNASDPVDPSAGPSADGDGADGPSDERSGDENGDGDGDGPPDERSGDANGDRADGPLDERSGDGGPPDQPSGNGEGDGGPPDEPPAAGASMFDVETASASRHSTRAPSGTELAARSEALADEPGGFNDPNTPVDHGDEADDDSRSVWPDAVESARRSSELNRLDLDREERTARISELAALALSAMTCRRPQRVRWVAINDVPGSDGTRVRVAELQGYGPVTTEMGEELLASGLARAPDPPSGREPTAEQAARHDPPKWLDREVRIRDGTCRYPGCRHPAQRVDLDHTLRFPEGLTVASNLGALCRRHHLVKHSGAWAAVQGDAGVFTWTSSITGRTYVSHARGTTGQWRGADHSPEVQTTASR